MTTTDAKGRALGRRSYGSIPHLPGSRRNRDDIDLNDGQAKILTERTRDQHDLVIVREKLDGTNVAVARVGGEIIPVNRAGYHAATSPWLAHQSFAEWLIDEWRAFDWLSEGQRVCGEWIALAHGTRYADVDQPFIPFDIMEGSRRLPHADFMKTLENFDPAPLLHIGGACSVEQAMTLLGRHGRYGATDPAEGCVWRVERRGEVDFLGKFVRPDKMDGKYLSDISGGDDIWNWKPS